MHITPQTLPGKVCPKHPELKGERYVSNKQCPACVSERNAKYRLAKSMGANVGSAAVSGDEYRVEGSVVTPPVPSDSDPEHFHFTASTKEGEAFLNRIKAIEVGVHFPAEDTKYRFGKVCAKHPQLFGKRYRASNVCAQCAKDYAARQYADRKVKKADGR